MMLSKKTGDKAFEVDMLLFASKVEIAHTLRQAQSVAPSDGRKLKMLEDGCARALKSAGEGLKLARRLNSSTLIAAALYEVAKAKQIGQRTDDAFASASDAIKVFRGNGDVAGEVACMILQAEVLVMKKELDTA